MPEKYDISGEIDMIVKNVPYNLEPIEIVRWIYLKLGSIFSYNLKILTEYEKSIEPLNYKQNPNIPISRYQTCIQISEIFSTIINNLNIPNLSAKIIPLKLVKEKLEELGIPVLVEMSSYESHPLGRLEWIKLFGVLLGKEDEAAGFFDAQVKEIEPILKAADTADEKADAKSVAICAVTSNGSITVRKPNDYVSKMISLAGGKYALSDYVPEEENALSTMNMQMEDFYAAAKDADILIYNGTIEGELGSIEELTSKNELFADFKAVKDGQVYTTDSSFYQQTTGTCDFIKDLNQILQGNDTDYRFLTKLK